jgi:hypothetical protein
MDKVLAPIHLHPHALTQTAVAIAGLGVEVIRPLLHHHKRIPYADILHCEWILLSIG